MMTMTAAEVRRRTGTSTVVPESIEDARYKQHTHTLDKNGSLYDPAGTES